MALLTEADPRWAKPELWRAIREVGQVYTDTYYLTALDLERNAQNEIQPRESARIYIQLYTKTLSIALIITLLRSEEHTSELQSLMRISYAVFCLKKKNKTDT